LDPRDREEYEVGEKFIIQVYSSLNGVMTNKSWELKREDFLKYLGEK
jgi:hypothetical protein